jgi:glutamate synthase (ferredoxin)
MSSENPAKAKDQVVHRNGFSSDLDRLVAGNTEVQKVIWENVGSASLALTIQNTDRSVCSMLAGDIARKYGNYGFKGCLNLQFKGSAGQSFGAFVLTGLNVRLEGEANDYVGKGMNGGEIVVSPNEKAGFVASESSIVGNACLYGATGGDFYAYGRAGERFAVRNSGAMAVTEGTGDHCCEYMTGGVVVVLGPVGRNVGAGMTGGLGYFYDTDGIFVQHLNTEIVKVQRIPNQDAESQLKSLIEKHWEKTGSLKAKMILSNWDLEVQKFWQVYPPSEAKTSFVSSSQLISNAQRAQSSVHIANVLSSGSDSQISANQTATLR